MDFVVSNAAAAPPVYSVSIRSDSSGSPGASVGTLTNPASLQDGFGIITYSAPEDGIALRANTTYFVMVDVSSGGTATQFTTTASDAQDSSSESDWSIADTSLWRLNYTTGTWTTATESVQISVRGHEAPPMVSTTGQTVTGGNAASDIAQAFTTGSNSGGYVLTRVDWKFKRDGTNPITLANLVAEIRQDSSGNPGAVVATLTDPASLPSDGLAEFTAPGDGILLAANTTYFAVFDVSTVSTDDVYQTASDAEDTGAATGWSIADSHLWRAVLATSWASPTTDNNTMAIAIHGYSVAPKLVGNTKQTTNTGNVRAQTDWAQSFTTGSNASGYKLTRADIRMQGGSGTAPTYTASIHSDSSNSPGTSLGTLTNPAAWPSSFGLARHFAGGSIDLEASTTYWLVFDITANQSSSTSQWVRKWTDDDPEDSGGAAGWSIGNGGRERFWNTTTWGSVGTDSPGDLPSRQSKPRPDPAGAVRLRHGRRRRVVQRRHFDHIVRDGHVRRQSPVYFVGHSQGLPVGRHGWRGASNRRQRERFPVTLHSGSRRRKDRQQGRVGL